MDELLQKVSQFGYPGLFVALVLGIVGLPVPDETLLVFFGYLASTGKMHPVLTWLTALSGSVGGISGSYWVGRLAGYGVVHRFGRYIHLTEDRLGRVQRWFDRIGHWLLTVGYFIPGVRHATALVSGMSGVSFKSFALFAYPGALVWVSTFLGIGFYFGERWRQVFDALHHGILIAILAIVVLGWVAWVIASRRKSKSKTQTPASKN